MGYKPFTSSSETVGTLLRVEERIVQRLRQVIEQKAQEVYSQAKHNVSGGVLQSRKGRVLRSIGLKTYETENGPGAKIYSRYFVARFWERGFGGKAVSVKAHVRHLKQHNVSARVLNEATGKTRKKKVAEGIAFVKAYTRNVPRQQRSFLKPALDQLRSEIRGALQAAVKGAV